MRRKTLKSILIVTVLALFLTIPGITLSQASQGQGIPQVIAQLQSNISNLAEKVESYYQELKSLILGSEEKISELNERVETLEAKVVELEQKVAEIEERVKELKSPLPPIPFISAEASAKDAGGGKEHITVRLQFGDHPYQFNYPLYNNAIVWGVLHGPSGDVGSIGDRHTLQFLFVPIPPSGTKITFDIYLFTAGALTHGTAEFIQPPM